jgi:hypothetical protein
MKFMKLIHSGLLASTVLIAALVTTPVIAHHSFASEFDINRPIELEGVVTRMQWSNPHTWVHLEITLNSGEKQQWTIEGSAPNALLRRGWDRDSLAVGTFIKVEGFQARDRSNKANGRNVILPDGSRLFVGSSGTQTGAPE